MCALGAAGGGRVYQPISAEQLRAALNAATFGGGGGGGGLGGANSGSSAGRGLYSGGSGMGGQASTSTSTLTSPAITQDQLAAALAAATGGGAAGMVKGHWRYHFLLFETFCGVILTDCRRRLWRFRETPNSQNSTSVLIGNKAKTKIDSKLSKLKSDQLEKIKC